MSQLEVEWVLPDGRAGGRTADGTVVRLAGRSVPGDVVAWEATGQRGHTVEGRVEAVVTPSADRVTPACPWDAECGGCDLAVLAPAARHRALARMVGRAFRRDTPPPVVPSPRPTGHRARIKLAIDAGRVGYRRPRSHALLPVGTCRAARPEVQAALADLRGAFADDPARTRGLANVELRSDGTRVVFAFTSAGPVRRDVREGLAALGDVALDGKTLAGDPRLVLTAAGATLHASPRSFYQVNLEANALLVDHVLGQLAPCERVLDLYSGIGNFAIPLAQRGTPVVAVEAEGQAVGDLKRAAAGLPVQAIVKRVERFDTSMHAFDGVILDPPRAGARGVLERVVRNRPRVIVYVACHAPSAARDLKEARGYEIRDVRCVDLFPDTHHIETVVTLVRR